MGLPSEAAFAVRSEAHPASPRERLAALLVPELLDALEELVDERVATQLTVTSDPTPAPWLTLDQAAARLHCSRDAVRMRAARGRLTTRRHGRRLYVSAASVAELA